jgi:hypothetical protein
VLSFAEKVDRWIDAICAGVRIYEDRALDPRMFETTCEDGPTDEMRHGLLGAKLTLQDLPSGPLG